MPILHTAQRLVLWASLALSAAAQTGPVVQPVIVPPEAQFSYRHPAQPPGAASAPVASGTSVVAPTQGGSRGITVTVHLPGYQDLETTIPLARENQYWDASLNGWRVPLELTPDGPYNMVRHQVRFHPFASLAGATLLLALLGSGFMRYRRHEAISETVAEQLRVQAEALREHHDPDLTGRRIEDYRLLRKLGEGASAQVYLAQHIGNHRPFALKLLRRNLVDEDTIKRIRREMQVGGSLQHPNLVGIAGYGTHERAPYLVMDYIEGETLDVVLERGPLAEADALALFRQMCEGVRYAHERNVMHRDLKPENMILTPDGQVKILDFGVARRVNGGAQLTATGQAIGTPAFMAPEQLMGSPGLSSDVYALGVVLFLLLTGRLPFDYREGSDVLSAHLTKPAPKPSTVKAGLSPELDDLCLAMLEKSVDNRVAGVAEVLRRVDAYLESQRKQTVAV